MNQAISVEKDVELPGGKADVLPRAILFVHHANDMYGADIGLLHSIHSLDRSRYYPVVILPSDMPEGMLSQELDRLGIEYHFVPLGILRRKYFTGRAIIPLLFQILTGSAAIRSMARSRKAALVYVNTIVAVSGAMGGRLAGIPVLWHIREIVTMPRPIRWTLHKLLGLCSRRIVCISNAVRESLTSEAPRLSRKTTTLYNGVAVTQNIRFKSGAGLREELSIPEGVPLVGMVGRVSHWKGQEILAEAAQLVLQSYPDVHFVAVGSYFADQSHYLRELEERIINLGLKGRFHLVSYRSDIGSVYDALDIFVLPSRKPEPFGRVTVEAMMHGLAVVATNHGGTCELIRDGVTGLLVPPSDPGSLAVAIERLLKDRAWRDQLGQSASRFAHESFSLPKYEERMRELIAELALCRRQLPYPA
jgi:glycosyltransferase involved in cell wall biosynthesis